MTNLGPCRHLSLILSVLFLCFWLPATYSRLFFLLGIWHLGQPASQHLQVIASHTTQAISDVAHLPVVAGTAGFCFCPTNISSPALFFWRKRQCVQPWRMNHSWSRLSVVIPIHFPNRLGFVVDTWPSSGQWHLRSSSTGSFWQSVFSLIKEEFLLFGKLPCEDVLLWVVAAILWPWGKTSFSHWE